MGGMRDGAARPRGTPARYAAPWKHERPGGCTARGVRSADESSSLEGLPAGVCDQVGWSPVTVYSQAHSELLPPLGHTGVEVAPVGAVGVSWLAGTMPASGANGVADLWLMLPRLGLAGSCQSDHGDRHYEVGIHEDHWGWAVRGMGRGGASGTVYVEVRQGWLEADGAQASRAVQCLIGSEGVGLRLSRLDLAADYPWHSPRPSDYWAARGGWVTRTHRASWLLTVDGAGGEKLTIGSRSSTRYLRVYLKPEREVVRHELECKAELARELGGAIASGQDPASLWAAECARLIRWSA